MGDELIGKTLGQFEIIEEIGRGGMATVYRARQLSMNRIVAVKVLPRHLMHDPSFYERFEREVEVITNLEHPHILPIIDYGQADSMPYIAMRFLGGGSLEQRIRRGLPPLSEVVKPLRQIAQALDHAHKQGIIHRDLKPGNIMLDEHGNAYLSDFGIARVLGSQLTGSLIVGTPAYMSPEQANGMPLDGRSDIYALGVVLFEMLTGHGPFQAETPMAMLLKHINEPVPPLRQFRNDVPDDVEIVVATATAKDPDNRYSSATQMIDALEAALQGRPIQQVTPTKRVEPAHQATQITGSIPSPLKGAQPVQQAIPTPTGSMSATGQTGQMNSSQVMNGTMQQAPARRISPLIILAALLVIGALAVGVPVMLLNNQPTPVDINAVPTAFPRGSTINQPDYSISIPDDWIPPSLFIDRSEAGRLVNVWESPDDSAFVTLSLVAQPTGTPLSDAIASYEGSYYTAPSLTFIDESTAEDGTVRRSYRLDGTSGFAPGQMDVFYMQRAGDVAVVEMYTADTTGNSLVPLMQLILDSVRIKQS